MSIIGDRTKQRRTELGLSQNQLVDRMNEAAGGREVCSQPKLGQLEKGETKQPRYIFELADALGVSVDWLRGKDDAAEAKLPSGAAVRDLLANGQLTTAAQLAAPTPAAKPPAARLAEGIVEIGATEFASIPRFDAALSAGPGSIMEAQPEPLGYHLCEMQWLRTITNASPSSLAILRVDGDSMEGTLLDGDWVLVDRTQARLNRSGIYALMVGDVAWVKRVELDLANKRVQVISDNPRYPMQVLREEDLSVIGRVVRIVSRKV